MWWRARPRIRRRVAAPPHTPRHAAARTHPAAARQTLTKAALSVYKGTAIEMHDAETGETKVLEDSQLISMLHLQMAQCQSAESCQLIMSAALPLLRAPRPTHIPSRSRRDTHLRLSAAQ